MFFGVELVEGKFDFGKWIRRVVFFCCKYSGIVWFLELLDITFI